jgi:hypothetical protein
MISSSSSVLSTIFSIGVKLTGESTSLEEPTDDSYIAVDVVFSADGPDSSDLKGELFPKIQRES